MVFFAPETCFVWDHTRARGCVSSEHTLNQSEGMYALFSEATCTYSRLPHNPYPIKCILLDKSHKFEQAENFAFAKSLALFMVGIISAPYVAGTHFAGRSEWVWVMRELTVGLITVGCRSLVQCVSAGGRIVFLCYGNWYVTLLIPTSRTRFGVYILNV